LLGTLYGLYGNVLRDEEKPLDAIVYYKKWFTYSSRLNFDRGCGGALNSIGFVYSTILHQNKIAIQYYFKALKYADTNEALNIYDNIANIYAKEKKYDSSFYYFQKAFDQLRPGITEKDLLNKNILASGSEITEYLTGMVLDKAATNLSKYKETGDKDALNKAINIYKITDQYFDKLKEIQSDIQSKLFWKSNNRRLYEQAIEACYLEKEIEQAFYFFEKSRAVLLNDQVNEQRWMADEDIANQTVLKKNIIDLNLKLNSTAPSSDEYLKIQKDRYLKNQQLDILTDSIKNKNPLYYKNYLDTSFISMRQLRKNILKNNQSLIEIFSGDSAIYVLTITNSNESLAKINKQLYDSLATSFNSFISNPARLNKDFKGWVNTSHQLYALVFKNNILSDGSIIISPDGINYPFEALVISGKQDPDYFLNHYATSYTYSAKYLTNQFAVNINGSNTILGIAPLQYQSYLSLVPLEGSDLSLNKINTYFSNATNYVLGQATKGNFLENFPDYNIVQLYTHASDSSGHNDPVIYFADSALYLSSLLSDRKPITQLVVLSACETANGKFYQGEGIFSFNRGFAALGIPAAISNLWSVENESTYRITELFYKYLSKGLPTDVALQKAKLEFINKSDGKEKKLPYYWAGAILTGKVEILKSNHSLPWMKITIVLIVLLGVSLFIKRFFLQKKATQNPKPYVRNYN
jgi:CHAT domain-containing protein